MAEYLWLSFVGLADISRTCHFSEARNLYLQDEIPRF